MLTAAVKICKQMTYTFLITGFVQKSDCGFPDFSRTNLLLLQDFSRHFPHPDVNRNITKLAIKR